MGISQTLTNDVLSAVNGKASIKSNDNPKLNARRELQSSYTLGIYPSCRDMYMHDARLPAFFELICIGHDPDPNDYSWAARMR